jgi:hypothetical protein
MHLITNQELESQLRNTAATYLAMAKSLKEAGLPYRHYLDTAKKNCQVAMEMAFENKCDETMEFEYAA